MAARFCPQCGREVSSGAKFCPHCGAALAHGAASSGAPAPAHRSTVETAARGTRRLLLPLGISALIVLAVAVAVLANRLHEESLLASRSLPLAAPPLTNAPAQGVTAPPLTNAPTVPIPTAAPLTNAPTVGPGQLPPDVAAYLKFLQGIETQRVALDNTDYSQINESITQAVNASNAQNQEDPDQTTQNNSTSSNGHQINQPLTDYENKWQSLISNFQSETSPASCTLLANNYSRFLHDDFAGVVQLHVGILNLLASTKSETGGGSGATDLTSELLKNNNTKDQEGIAADTALAQLCQNYNASKPFSIQPEGSSSSLVGQ